MTTQTRTKPEGNSGVEERLRIVDKDHSKLKRILSSSGLKKKWFRDQYVGQGVVVTYSDKEKFVSVGIGRGRYPEYDYHVYLFTEVKINSTNKKAAADLVGRLISDGNAGYSLYRNSLYQI